MLSNHCLQLRALPHTRSRPGVTEDNSCYSNVWSRDTTYDAHQVPCPLPSLGDMKSLLLSIELRERKPRAKKRAPISFLLQEEGGKSDVALQVPRQ